MDNADLFRMDQAGLPFGVRMVHVEIFVVRIFVAMGVEVPVKAAAFDDRHFVAEVHTCLIRVTAASHLRGTVSLTCCANVCLL